MEPKQSERLDKVEQAAVFRRALAAYFGDPETTDWPDTQAVGFKRISGLNYVVLYDSNRPGRVLACYRIRHDGKLKRLVHPPDKLRGSVEEME